MLCGKGTVQGGPERYAFVVEYLDPHAALTFTYQLMYYLADGSIEMYDVKNRRTFLKRVVYPDVSVEQLYLGSTITVYSRQLNIVDYADVFTMSVLAAKREKTFAMIKPAAVQHMGKIMNAITKSGFIVSKMKMVQLSIADTETFYAEHVGKPFFPELQASITAGPMVAMELVASDCVAKWRALLGPTDVAVAKVEAPESIRAKFGIDKTQNACHGSDSQESAARELGFFFGGAGPKAVAKEAGSTCAILKPHAVTSGYVGLIIDQIMANFEVTAAQMYSLKRANAMEFYEVYKGVVPEFSSMVDELTSGPFVVLELCAKSGEEPVDAFRAVCGPPDPEIARVLRPKSLRAQFGVDKVKNAVHCTDLPEDGALEVHYFYSILS